MKDGRPIAGFEEKYLITPLGEVWSLANHQRKPGVLGTRGYLFVTLALDRRKEQHTIHRLVARHFLPNPYDHPQVNHIDGCKTHNAMGNLKWVSAEGNVEHALRTGLTPRRYIPFEQKTEWLHRVLAGELIVDVARGTPHRQETMARICRVHADKLGLTAQWQEAMLIRRKTVALRQLAKADAANRQRREDHPLSTGGPD